jgi:uncharacterized protein DUF1952
MVRHDYYGVPDWLMVEYLEELGGLQTSDFVVQGEGWSASISKATPNRIGVLEVGGATVEFTGDDDVLEALFVELHKKTQRGGG